MTTSAAATLEQQLQTHLGEIVFGAEDVIHLLTIALIARGHVLLEGPPGIGKTLLSKSLAALLGGEFKRVQATADLMPADIIGVHLYDQSSQRFEFRPGPLFADVLLVDEINRTGPKTQSALLQAMEEREVSIDRERFELPDNFLVIATQNPHEFEGTYPLPESQLDRFLMRLEMDHPARNDELQVLQQYGAPARERNEMDVVSAVLDDSTIAAARAQAAAVTIEESVYGYLLDLAAASREHNRVALGLSTRGALGLVRCARVEAALQDRDFLTPDDIKALTAAVMRHRLVLTPETMLEGLASADIVEDILASVDVPR
ncbi:MAG: MoxR family ATPase [Gammaproteobacteria bacterium]|nr:MoxR family ATPase [Gammaproteobacteria bacterium]